MCHSLVGWETRWRKKPKISTMPFTLIRTCLIKSLYHTPSLKYLPITQCGQVCKYSCESARTSQPEARKLLERLDRLLTKEPPQVEIGSQQSEIDSDYIRNIHESTKTQNRQELLPDALLCAVSKGLDTARRGSKSDQPLCIKFCSVGCGDGLLDYRFLKKFLSTFPDFSVNYTGVDLTELYCEQAREMLSTIDRPEERFKFQVKQQDFEREDVTSLGSFDFVYSIHVIYHVTDLTRMIEKVLSLVKPGGKAVVGALTDQGLIGMRRILWKHEGTFRHTLWTSNDVMKLLEKKQIKYERYHLVPMQNIQNLVDTYDNVNFEFKSPQAQAIFDFACHTSMRWYCKEAVDLCMEYLKTIAYHSKDHEGLIIDHPTDIILITDK